MSEVIPSPTELTIAVGILSRKKKILYKGRVFWFEIFGERKSTVFREHFLLAPSRDTKHHALSVLL